MKLRMCSSCILLAALWTASAGAQSTPPQSPQQSPFSPDDVVAVIDGKEYTIADIERIRGALPPQYKQQTAQMTNKGFITVYGELLGFAKMAEKEGMLDQEPYRTQLEFNRMNYMAQIYLSKLNSSLSVTEEDRQQYYEQHKSEYEEVRVSAIYLDYSPNPLPKSDDGQEVVTEDEARAKAESLVEKLRGGADFGEMVEKHSDDEASREKGGDLGFFNQESNLPQTLKEVIFALDVGEISDPVQQGGRFYIFKATERRPQPLEEIRSKIDNRVRSLKLKEKIDQIRATVPIEYKNEEYLELNPSGSTGRRPIQLPVGPK